MARKKSSLFNNLKTWRPHHKTPAFYLHLLRLFLYRFQRERRNPSNHVNRLDSIPCLAYFWHSFCDLIVSPDSEIKITMSHTSAPMSANGSTQITTVQSKGIYHGLPVYPPNIKGLRALVIGANGISGQAMVNALAENPPRWSMVYAMSRKPSSRSPSPTVKEVYVDLLDGPEAIAKVLKDNDVVV